MNTTAAAMMQDMKRRWREESANGMDDTVDGIAEILNVSVQLDDWPAIHVHVGRDVHHALIAKRGAGYVFPGVQIIGCRCDCALCAADFAARFPYAV